MYSQFSTVTTLKSFLEIVNSDLGESQENEKHKNKNK